MNQNRLVQDSGNAMLMFWKMNILSMTEEVVLISRVFPTLAEEYVRNEESLQLEMFTWKFQNVAAFERCLRESGDVSFTGNRGAATGRKVNG